MNLILVAVGCVLVVLTLLPTVRSAKWWIRGADFPRLQIACGLALVLAAYLLLYDVAGPFDAVVSLILAASLGYQGFRIFPYTPLAPKQVLGADPGDGVTSIRLLIANVLMENRRADDLLAHVRAHDPDLILAVETNAWWNERLSVLDRDYPHSIKQPQENYYGMVLYSKLELGSPEVRFLVEDDVPSIRTTVRLRSGDVIDFFGIHPRPPEPSQDTEERDAELLVIGKQVRDDDTPSIVAGDLNDVAWSHSTRMFQRISGALDPRRGRGMFSTFHAKYPMFRWPLDHVFFEDSFTLIRLQRLSSIGSDHFPVLAELCYQPKAAPHQEVRAADQDEREEAAETIEDGHEAAAK